MTTFFISDTHFFHENIIRFCNRPFSDFEEMNESMVESWNRVVSPGDTVYHLGDVSWRGDYRAAELISRLNGKKHLILGNHDKKLKHEFLDQWEEIHNYLRIDHLGQTVVLFHYPIFSWDKHYHGSFHLFGHVHGQLDSVITGRCMDVSVDSVAAKYGDYRPISWDEVKQALEQEDPKRDLFQEWNKWIDGVGFDKDVED